MPSKRIRKHLAGSQGLPKCGRQLSRPGLTVANQASMQTTQDPGEVTCRHCLRAVGLLAPLSGNVQTSQGGTWEDVLAMEEFNEE